MYPINFCKQFSFRKCTSVEPAFVKMNGEKQRGELGKISRPCTPVKLRRANCWTHVDTSSV